MSLAQSKVLGGEVDTDDFWTDDWCDFLDEQGVDYSRLMEHDCANLNARELRKVWTAAGRPGEILTEGNP